ncbi:MAG TPA: EF-hand domain-containing protein, partial [Burkholderiales bacterium]
MSSSFRRMYLHVLLGGAQLVLLVIGMLVPVRAVWLTCLSLIAAISLAAWIAVYRRLRFVDDTPTSTIAAAAQGYVELSGRCASTPGAPTLAPYSQLPCVWCRYVMDEHMNNKWVRRDEGETDASFMLADSTGSCVVDPAGAEIVTNTRDSWTEGDCRYTEWKILQHATVYVLGEFRTLSQELPAADMDSDISELLTGWKRDHAALLARFDRNHDGTIDLDEWEQVRLAARAEVEKNYREIEAAPDLSSMQAPRDGRPYLISSISQRELEGKYRLWTWVHLASFIAAMGGLGWNLIS